VKVGFITDGETAGGATAGNEQPVAKATVQWLNEHMNGLAGHPIALDICVDQLDPSKAIDCANQLIRDKVAVVVIGSDGVIESPWKILHDAHIPVINNAVTISTLLEDPTSTFIVNDPIAQVVDAPAALATDEHVKKVSVIVVDLPIATDIYTGSTPNLFKRKGLGLDVVPVALGTPDITPQAQQIVAKNPDGLVSIVGPDAFCIAALQGLRAVAFQGSRFMIQQCLTDATRKAMSGGELKGINTVSLAPLGDNSDTSMRQYQAVLDRYATSKVDPSDIVGLMVFQSIGALSVGTQGLKGAVTPASVTEALKGMKNEVLPGSGGRHFRCNGKASTARPAVCSVSIFVATLDAEGNAVKYRVENDAPIGG
jgi:branched-chain amino acid transport system substrate-binding protein